MIKATYTVYELSDIRLCSHCNGSASCRFAKLPLLANSFAKLVNGNLGICSFLVLNLIGWLKNSEFN